VGATLSSDSYDNLRLNGDEQNDIGFVTRFWTLTVVVVVAVAADAAAVVIIIIITIIMCIPFN
jgi:hypothetical protein